MIKSIHIKNFRLFNNKKIILGKYLTFIAGMNGTGKSTILGLLGNSCELKLGRSKNNIYRMEFSETLKGSIKYDPSGKDKYTVTFDDNDYRHFRVTWQDHKKRFRVIPYKNDTNNKRIESKKEWPVIYLGLSRLFPIGESKDEGIANNDIKLTDEENHWFIKNYTEILSSYNENIQAINSIKISETNKKNGVGIFTDKYDFLTNSAGQDNVGQILYALILFKRLQQNSSINYTGGLLLIDEIDATLHPLAQNKLIDLLINECTQLNIQVVCTTHSTSLLKHICPIIKHHPADDVGGNIELVYLTNENRQLETRRNSTYNEIEHGLLMPLLSANEYNIKIYSEDDEARWFIRNLLGKYSNVIDILNISLGWKNLIYLYKGDIEYFCNTVIVFDGDVTQESIDSQIRDINPKPVNMIMLPGDKRPEEVIYDYLLSLQSNHAYWTRATDVNLSWNYLNEHTPSSYKGDSAAQFKKWFNDHRAYFDSTNLFKYWLSDNQSIAKQFIGRFIGAYNIIAQRLFMRKLL